MTANRYKTVHSGKVISLNVNFNYSRHSIAVSVVQYREKTLTYHRSITKLSHKVELSAHYHCRNLDYQFSEVGSSSDCIARRKFDYNKSATTTSFRYNFGGNVHYLF